MGAAIRVDERSHAPERRWPADSQWKLNSRHPVMREYAILCLQRGIRAQRVTLGGGLVADIHGGEVTVVVLTEIDDSKEDGEERA